jgi:aminoglycoside phosphotransferase (APT) family kinase protein
VNAILARVDALRNRVPLDRYEIDDDASCVILTPRFRTSRHVVALLIPNGAVEPSLVVKIPRLPHDAEGISREARVLVALHEHSPDAGESVPRVVAYSDGDQPVLLETAFIGPLLTRAALRDGPSRSIDEVVRWLISLPRDAGHDVSFERLIEEPLAHFAETCPEAASEGDLVDRTLGIIEPLRHARVPHVLEHGDLSQPNLILLSNGRVGVVDWELAEEHGLPLHDLSFFLVFASLALRPARAAEGYGKVFAEAFFGRAAWAKARVVAYAEGLELERALLTPLFVACWARHTARLAAQLGTGSSDVGGERAAWVRGNRSYRLWRQTLDNVNELVWSR